MLKFSVRTVRSADLNVSGPTLAVHAFRAGLVDEVQVVVAPVIIGAGLSYYPDVLTSLALGEVRRFSGGMIWLRYDVTSYRAGTDSAAAQGSDGRPRPPLPR